MSENPDQETQPAWPPLLESGQTYATATDQISAIVLSRKVSLGWWVGFGISAVISLGYLVGAPIIFTYGPGLFGINIPVAWGFPIVNTVWWIGIGHAGTLISAILLLLNQKWRNSINRFAEAMTIFAVLIAGNWPILHLGRPWFFYWLIPYPTTMGVWPQFRSALVWDFFAISTYIIVSIIFWYMGMVPDLASLRDRARKRWQQVAYGCLSLGWRNSARHWKNYRMAYLLLAGFAAPLVVSVHSVISLDFAISIEVGYHGTIFPPYFVAGALYSGFCMVLTILVPMRKVFGLEPYITLRHLDNAAKLLLAAGLFVAHGYVSEFFTEWYSGSTFERTLGWSRMTGPYAFAFWITMFCNVAVVQLMWFRRVRLSPWTLWVLSLVINLGMWMERYMIVMSGPARSYAPGRWDVAWATLADLGTLIGSLGFFFMLMFLFVRFLPAISIFEVRELVHEEKEEG
jgi:molybdopterin-containing oxidoreductase family membrane subunit